MISWLKSFGVSTVLDIAGGAALLDAVDADVANELIGTNKDDNPLDIAYDQAITDARAAIRAHKETTT